MEKYSAFVGDYESDKTKGLMVAVDTEINSAVALVESYKLNTEYGKLTHEKYIEILIEKFNQKFSAYRDYASNDNNNQTDIDNARNAITLILQEIDNVVSKALLYSSKGAYPIVTTESNYLAYEEIKQEVVEWSKIHTNKSEIHQHCSTFENDFENKYFSTLNNLKYPTLSSKFITDFTNDENSKLALTRERLNAIYDEIKDNFQRVNEDTTTEEAGKLNNTLASRMDALATEYVEVSKVFVNLLKYELLSNAFAETSANEQLSLKYLSSYSAYNTNSLVVRYNYLFDNDKTEQDFAHPLTIGISSNNEVNAYDYAYFVLKLFSFVIIAYAIMAACHTISGETKDGSIRYFAIRPITRKDIYFGKLLAILMLIIILIIFSAVIAVLVGGTVYSFSSLNILTVFHMQYALVLSPVAMLALYVASLIIELGVYLSIAMLLSVLLKSDLLGVSLLLLFFIINSFLPMFIQGANTWLAFYPFSHLSIYTLFGSSVYAQSNNFYNLLLGTKVYTTTSLPLIVSVIVIVLIVVNLIAVKLFKNKEL